MFAEAYLNLIQEIPAEEITPKIIYGAVFLESEIQIERTNIELIGPM